MQQDNRDPDSPWGAGNNSPPDIDKILAQVIVHIKNLLPSGSPSKFLILLIIIFLGTLISTALVWSTDSDLSKFPNGVQSVKPAAGQIP